MIAYEDLNEEGQLQRLRHLAESALAEYHLQGAQLVLLSHGESTLFRVRFPLPGARHPYLGRLDNHTLVLRVQSRAAQGTTSLRSELLWLAALLRDTDLVVPEPVPTSSGSLWTELAVEGVPGPRQCALLRWVEGQQLDPALTRVALGERAIFAA